MFIKGHNYEYTTDGEMDIAPPRKVAQPPPVKPINTWVRDRIKLLDGILGAEPRGSIRGYR